MTFPRVKPAGWGVNAKLTSAEINQLDIDHANAIDKTGDTATGTIVFDGTVTMNATVNVPGNATLSGSNELSGELIVSSTAGITFDVGFPKLGATNTGRNRNIFTPPGACDARSLLTRNYAAVGSYDFVRTANDFASPDGISLLPLTTNTATTLQYIYRVPLRVSNGATIAAVNLEMIPSASHTGLPAAPPRIGVVRVGYGVCEFLRSANFGYVDITPVSLAEWNAGVHPVTYSPTQNNVVDTTRYMYYALIMDEAGTNALASTFTSLFCVCNDIPDLRPA